MVRTPQKLEKFVEVLFSRPTPEDVQSVLSRSRDGVLISVLNAIVYTASHDVNRNFAFVAIWCLLTLALCAVVYLRSSQATKREVTYVSARASRRVVLFAVLIALPWAVLAFVEIGYGAESDRILVFLVCAGMSAGGTFMLYRALTAALAYFATILVAIVVGSLTCCGQDSIAVLAYSLIYFSSLTYFAYGAGQVARQRDASVDALSSAIEEVKEAHDKNRQLVRVDVVTGLPNRKAFFDRLDEATRQVDAGGAPFTLVMFDLDRFKNINDTFGHSVGDDLLSYIAVRMRNELREGDMVARLGGDEFAILLAGFDESGRIEGFISRLGDHLKAPVRLAGRLIYTGASFGAATYPHHAACGEQLLLNADLALNRVKETERGRCLIFDESLRETIEKDDWLERELREALARDEVSVAYQPQVSLTDGRVVGAEALVRWIHPEQGSIAPDVFLGIAAERGLMPALSRHITDRIKTDILAWRVANVDYPRIALNIHPMDFRTPGVLFDTISRLVDVGITSQDILLEITEGCFLGRGTDAALFLLDELVERGFELSLDDFGTGHASISHLKKLPVSEIKIDRSFVRGIAEDPKDRSIVAATAEIARGMGIRSVAEGVENETHLEVLTSLGIDVGQGYYWAKALAPDAFAAFLADHPAGVQSGNVTPLKPTAARGNG